MGFLDESRTWRKCELAWNSWLVAQGWMVIPLGDLNADSNSENAPLTRVGGGAVRTPDILATQGGNNIYWEVKYRTRASVNAMTGQSEHWMSFDSFNDYLIFTQKSKTILKVILFEDATATDVGRWMEIDMNLLYETGRKEKRFSNSGVSIEAWVWPASSMHVVDGPVVDTSDITHPLLPEEGQGSPLNPTELQPIERNLRKKRRPAEGMGGINSRNIILERILDEDPVVGLDLLRRSLGIQKIPKYSVLKIGATKEEIEEILGLLHYGIRVFLVTSFKIEASMPSQELEAFRESRMLEAAVVENVETTLGWVVDGVPNIESDLNLGILEKAQESGGLNFHQYMIIHADIHENILVTAGAGTGKTETMSERIVFLLSTYSELNNNEGKNPITLSLNEIVLMTFTREAAIEIRRRLSSTLILRRRLARLCVMPTVSWLLDLSMTQIGTIHGYAKHLLQEIGTNVNLAPNFRVTSSTMDFRRLIHQALSEGLELLYVSENKANVPAAHEWEELIEILWQSLNNNGWRITSDQINWGSGEDDFQKQVVELVTSSLSKLSNSYADFCNQKQVLPTGELVARALDCVSLSVKGMKSRPRFIFIDEFQDTDSTQMDFILELQDKLGALLYVVGDAKQGIYRFRGAEGSAFSELRERLAKRGKKAYLERKLITNFRSSKVLLDSLHPHFEQLGVHKFLSYGDEDRLLPNPSRKDAGNRMIISSAKHAGKLEFVSKKVKAWRDSEDLTDIALLCRDNWQAVEIRNHLNSLDIPCELSIKGNFYQSPVILEFRILLESLCNPNDNAALLELLETRWSGGILNGQPPTGMPQADFECWAPHKSEIMGWNDRFASVGKDENFALYDLVAFRKKVETLVNFSRKTSPIQFLFTIGRTFTPESCASTIDIPGDDTELRRYRRGWDHLISILDSKFGRNPTTIHGLLDWIKIQIATNTNEDEPISAEDLKGKVTALTVHKAKGLEFDNVLIPYTDRPFTPTNNKREIRSSAIRSGNGEKAFLWEWAPAGMWTTFTNSAESKSWIKDDEEVVKEEARLFYVALTRAKHNLEVLVSPEKLGLSAWPPNAWQDFLYLGSMK